MSQGSSVGSSRGQLARSGAALAGATFASGLLGYAYIVILTRALGPEQYGVLGALLGLSVIFTVTFTAIQLDATRVVALAPQAPRGWLHRRAAAISVGTGLFILLASPVIVSVLRLPSYVPALALAAMMLPQTYLGVQLGILLGLGRSVAFGVLLVISGLSRVVAAVVTAALGGGPTFVLTVSTLTAIAVLGLGGLLLRSSAVDAQTGTSSPGERGWSGMLRATTGAGALLVLLNADLLAARAILPDRESGWYAFLTVFGRVTFWGTNFIALWVFPHEAARGSAAKARSYALAAVAILGVAACVIAALFAVPITRALAGEEYVAAAHFAPLFAVAGSLVAVIQLATYVDVARAQHLLSVIAWGGSAVMALIIWFAAPRTIAGAIWSAVLVLAVVAAAGLVSMRTPRETAPSRVDAARSAPR
ncbi:MAG: hypothetical protein WAS01_10365 [Nostocoides sp.]